MFSPGNLVRKSLFWAGHEGTKKIRVHDLHIHTYVITLKQIQLLTLPLSSDAMHILYYFSITHPPHSSHHLLMRIPGNNAPLSHDAHSSLITSGNDNCRDNS